MHGYYACLLQLDGRSLSTVVICSTNCEIINISHESWKDFISFDQLLVGIGACMVECVTHTKLMKIVDSESAGWKSNMTSAQNCTITFSIEWKSQKRAVEFWGTFLGGDRVKI